MTFKKLGAAKVCHLSSKSVSKDEPITEICFSDIRVFKSVTTCADVFVKLSACKHTHTMNAGMRHMIATLTPRPLMSL